MTKWIKCRERLPEFGEQVLAFDDGFYYLARLEDQSGINEQNEWYGETGRITPSHWAEIEPPEVE